MHEIVKAVPLEGFRIRLSFDDGTEGEIDVAKLTDFKGVFAALRDPNQFRRVQVHQEFGTVCWESGADLDPDNLYSLVTGRPVELRKDTATKPS